MKVAAAREEGEQDEARGREWRGNDERGKEDWERGIRISGLDEWRRLGKYEGGAPYPEGVGESR